MLTVQTHLAYRFDGPSDILLHIEAAPLAEQAVSSARLDCTPTEHFSRVPAQDGVGERIWLHHRGDFTVDYAAQIDVVRRIEDLASLSALPPYLLPGEAVPYLMDSRYCPAGRFEPFVEEQFGALQGGAKIVAMRDWIAEHFRYVAGTSDSTTTAIDSFVERRGVCRDFAHTMISFARAAAIPARFVSGYGPDVTPQDFHAVAEVFLADPSSQGGTWQMVDATGMATPREFAKIGVGRDAADASFLTCYGSIELLDMRISVTRGGAAGSR